jgi:hypothetical protein
MNVSSAGDIPAYCDRGSRLSIAQDGLNLLIFAKRKKEVVCVKFSKKVIGMRAQ